MKAWQLWGLAVLTGAALGLMGGVLTLRDPAGALLWAGTVCALLGGAVGLLWWRMRAVRNG